MPQDQLFLGQFCGIIASICFSLQYLPQALMNYNRKSTKGFSDDGIVIKLIGSSFLLANSFFLEEQIGVVLYGLLNVFQHVFFMYQFYIYSSKAKDTFSLEEGKNQRQKKYLLWMLFPFIPILLGLFVPVSFIITNLIKPAAQILSLLPQLIEITQNKSIGGVSMLSQHLNALGSIFGLVMCLAIPPISIMTYIIYINSLIQAISVYALAFYYGELFGSETMKKRERVYEVTLTEDD